MENVIRSANSFCLLLVPAFAMFFGSTDFNSINEDLIATTTAMLSSRFPVPQLCDQAQAVRRIQLHFLEPTFDHLQEFTVRRVTADGGQSREIVRQQWNFNPASSTSELEDYEVNLDGVSALEL